MAEKDDYLIDLLVDLGFVNTEQVAQARKEAESASVGVVDLLVANKLIRAADVTQAKAAHFGAEVVNLSGLQIDDSIIAAIPRHIAKKYRVVPVYLHDNSLTVAVADPSDLATIDSLTHLLSKEIVLQVASESDIEAALNKYYGGQRSAAEDERFKGVIEELTREHVEVNADGADDGADDDAGQLHRLQLRGGNHDAAYHHSGSE